MAEWNWEKNKGIDPHTISLGSGRKLWWLGKCGHEWEAIVGNRYKGSGCPICAGKQVLFGFNDLKTKNPAIAAEWHPTMNNGLSPSDVVLNSHQKAWWICSKCGQSWETIVKNRSKGHGCPYCAGMKVFPGINDLQTISPHLAAEWNLEKNYPLLPTQVTSKSEKQVWWKCSHGHEWKAAVYRRQKQGCPYCANKKVFAGYNDLASRYPDLAKEWHPTKNEDLLPSEVLFGSAEKVWWLCEHGHEWEASIANRCKQETGCPFCSGRRAIIGKNDIASTDAFLALEWNQEKNGISATEVSIRSGIKYWWKCSKCGFEWKASPHNRTNGALSTGCPKCAKETQTSYPEQVVFYYISKHYPDAINRYTADFLGRMELDIFIPSLKVGIEYDGAAWHSAEESRKREKSKYLACQKQGIRLIRICEEANEKSVAICDQIIEAERHVTNERLQRVLQDLSKIAPMEDAFTIDSEEQEIRANYIARFKENSLEKLCPNVAKYWNSEKNRDVSPDMISIGSSYRAWWICERGHEWQTVVSAMVKNRDKYKSSNGCPYCAGHRVIPGETDLKTLAPHLASEWDYEKNKGISPEQVFAQSNKKAWWICKHGHKWEAAINSRYSGNGCPYCGGKRILAGYNDFATKHPDLMEEWDFEKNTFINPTLLGAASKTKAWWICREGHQYEACISNRAKGQGCPYCTGKKVFEGINDLVTLNSALAIEWDFEKNTLDPRTISPNSHKKAWWKCSQGHSWAAEIRKRHKGQMCPDCTKQKRDASKVIK